MSEVQPKVGEKWVDRAGSVIKICHDFGTDNDFKGCFPLTGVCLKDGMPRTFTSGGSYLKTEDSHYDLVRKYVPPMPTGVWGVDNLGDKLLAELKEWFDGDGEIEDKPGDWDSPWRVNNSPAWGDRFYHRARGCTSEPQPQRKPITAEEAFDLWGKVICDRDGRRCRVSGHDENSLYFINIDGDAEFTTYQQLIDDNYTLDGHVICSGMSTKPQGCSDGEHRTPNGV